MGSGGGGSGRMGSCTRRGVKTFNASATDALCPTQPIADEEVAGSIRPTDADGAI